MVRKFLILLLVVPLQSVLKCYQSLWDSQLIFQSYNVGRCNTVSQDGLACNTGGKWNRNPQVSDMRRMPQGKKPE